MDGKTFGVFSRPFSPESAIARVQTGYMFSRHKRRANGFRGSGEVVWETVLMKYIGLFKMLQ